MARDVDDEDLVPRARKPSITIPGWLLFACLFLPTLRVCGDPTMPVEFPPTYGIYLGGLILGCLAVARALETRRLWFVAWFVLMYISVVGIGALWIGAVLEAAGVIVGLIGIAALFVVVPAVRRQPFGERAFWIATIIHAVLAVAWCAALAVDRDAMWGADVSLAVSVVLLATAVVALVRHAAELAARRRAMAPAPLPIARAVS